MISFLNKELGDPSRLKTLIAAYGSASVAAMTQDYETMLAILPASLAGLALTGIECCVAKKLSRYRAQEQERETEREIPRWI